MKFFVLKAGLASVILGLTAIPASAQSTDSIGYSEATECAALFTFVSMLMENDQGRAENMMRAESWSNYALSVAPEKRLIHASSVSGRASALVKGAQEAGFDQQHFLTVLAPVDGQCRVAPRVGVEEVRAELPTLSTQENERYLLWSQCAGHMLFVQINGQTYGVAEALAAMEMGPKIEAYMRQEWQQKEAEISNDITEGFRIAKTRATILSDPNNPDYAETKKFVETCDKIGGFVLLER